MNSKGKINLNIIVYITVAIVVAVLSYQLFIISSDAARTAKETLGKIKVLEDANEALRKEIEKSKANAEYWKTQAGISIDATDIKRQELDKANKDRKKNPQEGNPQGGNPQEGDS